MKPAYTHFFGLQQNRRRSSGRMKRGSRAEGSKMRRALQYRGRLGIKLFVRGASVDDFTGVGTVK